MVTLPLTRRLYLKILDQGVGEEVSRQSTMIFLGTNRIFGWSSYTGNLLDRSFRPHGMDSERGKDVEKRRKNNRC